MPRRKPPAVGPGRDGAGACGLFVRGLLRHPQRHGDWLNPRRGLGGAEAEVAATDGPPREDRLLRPDPAARGLRGEPRPDYGGAEGGGHLGPHRPDEVRTTTTLW